MGIKQSKYSFENLEEDKIILAYNSRSSENRIFFENGKYIRNPYYIDINYYSKINSSKKNKDNLLIYPINKDEVNFRLVIKKGGKILFDKEVKKKSFLESLQLINKVYIDKINPISIIDDKIIRKKFELEEKKLNPNEIEKINMELLELEKEKKLATEEFNQITSQVQKEKNQELNEYEKILISYIIKKQKIKFINKKIQIYDYSNFDKLLLNIDTEFKFNDLTNNEIINEAKKRTFYNEAFCYYIKDYLPKGKIYLVVNNIYKTKRITIINFSIIKDNEIKTYSGEKLKEFLDKNYKNDKLYIVNYLDDNDKRSIQNKDESSYSTSNLLLPLIAGYLYLKKR